MTQPAGFSSKTYPAEHQSNYAPAPFAGMLHTQPQPNYNHQQPQPQHNFNQPNYNHQQPQPQPNYNQRQPQPQHNFNQPNYNQPQPQPQHNFNQPNYNQPQPQPQHNFNQQQQLSENDRQQVNQHFFNANGRVPNPQEFDEFRMMMEQSGLFKQQQQPQHFGSPSQAGQVTLGAGGAAMPSHIPYSDQGAAMAAQAQAAPPLTITEPLKEGAIMQAQNQYVSPTNVRPHPPGVRNLDVQMARTDLRRSEFSNDEDYFVNNIEWFETTHPGVRTAFQFNVWREIEKDPARQDNQVAEYAKIFNQDEEGHNLNGSTDHLTDTYAVFNAHFNAMTEAEQMSKSVQAPPGVTAARSKPMFNTNSISGVLPTDENSSGIHMTRPREEPKQCTEPLTADQMPSKGFADSYCQTNEVDQIMLSRRKDVEYSITAPEAEIIDLADSAGCRFTISASESTVGDAVFAIERTEDEKVLLEAEMTEKLLISEGIEHFMLKFYPSTDELDRDINHYCPVSIDVAGCGREFGKLVNQVLVGCGLPEYVVGMVNPSDDRVMSLDILLDEEEEDSSGGIECIQYVKSEEEVKKAKESTFDHEGVADLADKLELHMAESAKTEKETIASIVEVQDVVSEIDNNVKILADRSGNISRRLSKIEKEMVSKDQLDVLTETINIHADMLQKTKFEEMMSMLQVQSDVIGTLVEQVDSLERSAKEVPEKVVGLVDGLTNVIVDSIAKTQPVKMTPADLLEKHITQEDARGASVNEDKEKAVDRKAHRKYLNTEVSSKTNVEGTDSEGVPKRMTVATFDKDWESTNPVVVKEMSKITKALSFVEGDIITNIEPSNKSTKLWLKETITMLRGGEFYSLSRNLQSDSKIDKIIISTLKEMIVDTINQYVRDFKVEGMVESSVDNIREVMSAYNYQDYDVRMLRRYFGLRFTNIGFDKKTGSYTIRGRDLVIISDNFWNSDISEIKKEELPKCMSSVALAPVIKQMKLVGKAIQRVIIVDLEGKKQINIEPFEQGNGHYKMFATAINT